MGPDMGTWPEVFSVVFGFITVIFIASVYVFISNEISARRKLKKILERSRAERRNRGYLR